MTENISFGTWLHQRRRTLDLTQQALAEQVGCARITLRRIEDDALKPSKELALVLLEKLEIPKAEREQGVRFARGQTGMPNDWPASTHKGEGSEDSLYSSQGIVSSLPTGTVTFLNSDIAGFTPRFKRDPDSALELLARHDQLLHPLMAEYGGKVFNVRGDNFEVAFTDPLRAVEAALAAQRLLATEDWGALGPVQTKMALHVGQAKKHQGGGYVSLSLGSLERIERFAQSGQILVSQAMADTIRAHLPPEIRLLDLGEHDIPTLGPTTHLFQIIVRENP